MKTLTVLINTISCVAFSAIVAVLVLIGVSIEGSFLVALLATGWISATLSEKIAVAYTTQFLKDPKLKYLDLVVAFLHQTGIPLSSFRNLAKKKTGKQSANRHEDVSLVVNDHPTRRD